MGGVTWHLRDDARIILNAGVADISGRPECGQVFLAQLRFGFEI
jgi:hypothetical protein